jgi:hypothetical protein
VDQVDHHHRDRRLGADGERDEREDHRRDRRADPRDQVQEPERWVGRDSTRRPYRAAIVGSGSLCEIDLTTAPEVGGARPVGAARPLTRRPTAGACRGSPWPRCRRSARGRLLGRTPADLRRAISRASRPASHVGAASQRSASPATRRRSDVGPRTRWHGRGPTLPRARFTTVPFP